MSETKMATMEQPPHQQQPDEGNRDGRKAQKGQLLERFLKFLYNKEQGEVLGRTAISWLKIFIFYVIFYGAVFAFFFFMFSIAMIFIPTDRPLYKVEDSFFSKSHGGPPLSFKPIPMALDLVINHGELHHKIINHMTKQLDVYLEGVNEANSDATNVKVCSTTDPANNKKSCKIDLKFLSGTECEKSGYGYDKNNSCILIKMNRIYGWVPGSDIMIKCDPPGDFKTKPKFDATYYSIDTMPSTSHGLIPSYYFPFLSKNQPKYVSPFVMVKFASVMGGVNKKGETIDKVDVECTAQADNLNKPKNNKGYKLSTVKFILPVKQYDPPK